MSVLNFQVQPFIGPPVRPFDVVPCAASPGQKAIYGPLTASMTKLEDYFAKDTKKRSIAAKKGHKNRAPAYKTKYPLESGREMSKARKQTFMSLLNRYVAVGPSGMDKAISTMTAKCPAPRTTWITFYIPHRTSIHTEGDLKRG